MHDPSTVAFEIKYPWVHTREKRPDGSVYTYRETFITVWHEDPEIGGDDDSCDWFGHNLTPANGWYPGHVDELNALPEESRRAVMFVWWQFRRQLGRPWWKHPRWHVHHWRIQVNPVQALKRFLFSRCSKCGKRFPWGYAPMSDSWNGTGPRWFRGEVGVFHHECHGAGIDKSATVDNAAYHS